MVKYSLNFINFVLLLFVDNILNGQNTIKHLYFITSNSEDIAMLQYTTEDNTWDDSRILYNCVWKLDKDTLILIDTLNFKAQFNTHLTDILQQEDDKCIVVKEMDRYDWRYFDLNPKEAETYDIKEYISIFKYDRDTLEQIKFTTNNLPKKFNVFGLKSYFINGKIYYFIGSDYQIPEYDYFINKNGDFIHQKRLWEINNFIVKTESSAIDSYYQRIRFSSGDDGKLKSGHTDDFDSWGDADFQGPIKSEDKEKYEGFTIFYLTPSSTFLIGKKDLINNSANDSLITYWYLDKRTQEWDTFNLSKFYSNFNVYNDAYLYGTGMNNLRFLSNADTISNLLEENSKFYSDSLGLIPIKQTLTGKFFIFHIPSKTFCEYLGNTQDTEVIQIIDDWIYYRDYDEIRRMKINHTSKIYDISTNELVVKDKYRVPMIHHLFFSNAYPKVNKKELFFQK